MGTIKLYDPTTPTRGGAPRAKRQYLPAATEAANAVAVILVKHFGQQAWILQCMAGIQECVQNSVDMLSGAAPMPSQPIGQGGEYAFPARTAAELQATRNQAAHAGQVSAAHEDQITAQAQADQALANGQLDMFAVLQKAAGTADPASQGMPAQEAPNNDPASDDWIL